MRKLVTALLLAGTLAAPLLAQDRPDGDRRPDRDQRRDARQDRPDHAGDKQRQDRPDQAARPDRDRGPDQSRPPQPPRDMRGPDRPDRMAPRPDDHRGPDRAPPRDAGRDRHDGRPGDRDGWRDDRRDDHRFDHGNARPGYGYRPGNGYRGANGGWTRDWRRDGRYNWRAYRSSNRALFRGPRWYAPRGANYRRFAVGYRFDPVFYGERYWIADPWLYHLPPAYGPYRWVRYYDDVALVNIYTGQIADIEYGFFY